MQPITHKVQVANSINAFFQAKWLFGISFARVLVSDAESYIELTPIFTTVQRSGVVCTKSKPKVKRAGI